jgi:hypothetical protein
MGQSWEGFTQKIRLVREQLDHLGDDGVVVVTDSYDLVFQAGPEVIDFAFALYGKPVVFSSERGHGFPRRNTELPATPNPLYRSICAGFWMARVRAAREMIDEAYGRRGKSLCDSSIDDQDMLEGWFAANHSKAAVDYRNVLVTSAPREYFYIDIDCRPGAVYNKTTNTIPCAIHGNGDADMRPVYEALGLPGQGEASNSVDR